MRMDALRGPDIGTLLIRAIRASAQAAACPVHVVAIEGRPWASATFTGMRHRLTLAAETVPHVRAWIDALPEAELRMRGHIVADLAVEDIATVGDALHVTLVALTLIEA